jgi:hypothetical protein
LLIRSPIAELDSVFNVVTTRTVNGKPYEFSCNKGVSTGGAGVAVRSGADWLCKYLYENGKQTEVTKMSGTDDDVKNFRAAAAELSTVVTKAVK